MRYVVAFALTAALAGAQRKLDDEQAALLAGARAAALNYTVSLPDFLCTESINRLVDPRSDDRWHHVDTLTVRLSYFGHREDYKLIAVDGRPTDRDYLGLTGSLTTGEFGSRLASVFLPDSKASFEWKGWKRLRGRRAAIFHYRIARENSTFRVQFGTSQEKVDAIFVAYRGEVAIDEATHRVLQLTSTAEMPVGFPIRANTFVIDYDFREVGGREFLLPVRAEAITKSGSGRAANRVEFRDYRKFGSDATITFEPPVDKP